MSNTADTEHDEVLDAQTLRFLAEAPVVQALPPERRQAMRDRVMRRIGANGGIPMPVFRTVRAEEGDWIALTPKISKKMLFLNPLTGAECYLLKGEPGAELPAHWHAFDEHCLILDGEVTFSPGIHLRKGDYHFAPGNSEHGAAYTERGALVYLQIEAPPQSPGF